MGNMTMSEFYCTQCGNKGLPVWRKKGAEREAGHLKKLFCLNCKKETNHCECRPFTKYEFKDFQIEYEYGNFSEDGQRIKSYNKLKELINNGQIEKMQNLFDGRNSRFRQNDLDTKS